MRYLLGLALAISVLSALVPTKALAEADYVTTPNKLTSKLVIVPPEVCGAGSRKLCASNGALCGLVHDRSGEASEVCRWVSVNSKAACKSTSGIWTTPRSKYARKHPDAVESGSTGACITEVKNIPEKLNSAVVVRRDHRTELANTQGKVRDHRGPKTTTISSIPAAGGAVGGGSAGLGYECSNPLGSKTPKCTCSGYLDCKKLVKSGNCCPLDDPNCGESLLCSRPSEGGAETCECDWLRAKTSDRFQKRPKAPVDDKVAPAERRDHRIESSSDQRKVRDHRMKSLYLTNDECTELGGDVKDASISICESGQHCNRAGRDGTIYRVCISKTDTATKNAPKALAPQGRQRPGELTLANPSRVVVATALTNEECEGLGGVVRNATECGVVKKACITVDPHGVIRTACINKASE